MLTLKVKPLDSFNSNPPPVEFHITEKHVYIELRDDKREVAINKEDFKKLLTLI